MRVEPLPSGASCSGVGVLVLVLSGSHVSRPSGASNGFRCRSCPELRYRERALCGSAVKRHVALIHSANFQVKFGRMSAAPVRGVRLRPVPNDQLERLFNALAFSLSRLFGQT
ncbi:Uncharacterized protein DAT39_020204, partial [Clarias magur]